MTYLKNFIWTSLILALCVYCTTNETKDPLPSWNEGSAKAAILNFVQVTTDKTHPSYVPPDDRVAAFDQDGTLWVEQPLYTQFKYCLDRLDVLIAEMPELENEEPFKTLRSGDKEAIAKLTLPDIVKIAIATITGMSTEQFQAEVRTWMKYAKDPRWNRPYPELIYQPMKEVIDYLHANEFKVYIVTGGGQDFVRVYSENTYGIPSEYIVGTAFETSYGYNESGKPILTIEPKVMLANNYNGKPEGIHLMIGRKPNAAFGNSNGDRQMLEFTKSGEGERLAMLLLHDDGVREYAYGPAEGLPNTKVGTFSQDLYDQAIKSGWIVISMKKDWKRIFSFDQ